MENLISYIVFNEDGISCIIRATSIRDAKSCFENLTTCDVWIFEPAASVVNDVEKLKLAWKRAKHKGVVRA